MDTYYLYQQTIIELFYDYKEFGMYSIDDEIIDYCAKALSIEKETLIDGYFKDDNHQGLPNYKYKFLDNIIKQYIIQKMLATLKADNSYESVMNNYLCYREIVLNLNLINSNIIEYLSIQSGHYTYEYLLTSYGEKMNCQPYLELLELYYNNEDYYRINCDNLSLIYLLLNYEIDAFLNLLLFINSLLVISESNYIDNEIKTLAKKIWKDSFNLYKDARIIAIRINSCFHNLKKPKELRVKSDNTSLLQMFYSYPNTDIYSIRLDLPHQGINNIHYNNVSAGNTKSFLFKKEEYIRVVEKCPKMKECFIKYSEMFALKERINCPKNKEIMAYYERLVKEKEHELAFPADINEERIIQLFDILHFMLPDYFYAQIDTTGLYSKRYFNYADLMGIKGLTGLCLSLHHRMKEVFLDRIVNRAIYLGIISAEEAKDYRTIEGVCQIASLAKERAEI